MDVPVLRHLAHALAAQGIATLRFNFRGVGTSQGAYDSGHGETNDLIGALDALASQTEVDSARLAVIGYSFGAWIGGRALVRDDRVGAFVAIALPMSASFQIELGRYNRPKCFITGAQDTISAPELLRRYVGSLPEPKTLHVLPDADHSLLGSEDQVSDIVTGFLAAAL
jgi:alpha/beta superfamily hydrolase